MRKCRLDELMDMDVQQDLQKLCNVSERMRDRHDMVEAAYDTEIADLTTDPTDDMIYESIVNASDAQHIEFCNAYKAGLPLGNILRKMIKANAIFRVKGND